MRQKNSLFPLVGTFITIGDVTNIFAISVSPVFAVKWRLHTMTSCFFTCAFKSSIETKCKTYFDTVGCYSQVIFHHLVLKRFFLQLISAPPPLDISPHVYKSTQDPSWDRISPGFLTRILRYSPLLKNSNKPKSHKISQLNTTTKNTFRHVILLFIERLVSVQQRRLNEEMHQKFSREDPTMKWTIKLTFRNWQ